MYQKKVGNASIILQGTIKTPRHQCRADVLRNKALIRIFLLSPPVSQNI